jgi:hypothetical protein
MSPPERPDVASAPGALRVVVLTAGGPYGLDVVARLAARGVPHTVLLQRDAALVRCFRTRGWRRAIELPVALARVAWRLRLAWRRRRALQRHGATVHVSGALNAPRMRGDLARLAPDVLVLAGIGIVDEPLLATARLATLNGHPGLLPWVRGNAVVAHSVARGVAVGATVHRVNAGIDTGPVVARRLLPVGPDASLAALEREALGLAADLLAEVVADAVACGEVPAGAPQSTRTPLCRWMGLAARRRVEAVVREGAAQRRFESWREACEPPGPPWELPPDGAFVAPRAGDA